ncbi:O-antigen ligase family protein [Microterricola viridarii]|uniref:O-antigen ligase-related domain-containing protein n=1 Tax=Microterricola viridarii TaxID=412690 RepID=A0A1H1ZIL6_9MICO|nr:O-antigen ligase family protein [Microterricola viridarii]SDT33635.1 hypothetical protein SAMN04489834_3477 [Microterricola viridarii]
MNGKAGSSFSKLVGAGVWVAVAVAALALSGILDSGDFSIIASVPVVLAALAYVLKSSQSVMVSALIASLVLLAISRSVLTPQSLTTATPVLVVALLGLALAMSWRRLSMPRSTIFVIGLVVLLILPTVVGADLATTAKALGIGTMWFLVFVTAANLGVDERQYLLRAFIGLACITAVIALCETLTEWQFVRDFVAGSATTDSYTVRKNRLLGDWTNRAQATFGYPIPFAAFLCVALLTALLSKAIQRPAARAAIIALLASAILLTGTRSAIAALAAGLAVYCISQLIASRSTGEPLRKLAVPLAGTSLLVLAGVAFLLRSIATQDFSLLHRSSIVEAAIGLFALPPLPLLFGSGYNSAAELFEAGILHSDGLQTIDNALISLVIVSGLVGLAVFVVLALYSLRNSGPTGRAVIASLIACFLFFDVMSWHAITFLLFVAFGFATPTSPAPARPTGFKQLARDLVSPRSF